MRWCKLKGANELLPNELNHEKRNTQVQVGGEGRADIRIVNCFVSVFLSFSLLAFTLAFPGISGRERGQQRREMPERLEKEGWTAVMGFFLISFLKKIRCLPRGLISGNQTICH